MRMGYQGEKLTKGIVSGPALLGLVYRLGEERERTMDKERLPPDVRRFTCMSGWSSPGQRIGRCLPLPSGSGENGYAY